MEAVRRATTDDVSALVELAEALSSELAPMRGGAIWHARDARGPSGNLATEFRSLLSDPDATVLVGTIDDVVVGFAAVVYETLHDGGVLARITELFVLDDARAVGVGELIADEIVREARARGCVGVDAPALPGHRAAKNFFERQGFTARLITMHKPLA